ASDAISAGVSGQFGFVDFDVTPFTAASTINAWSLRAMIYAPPSLFSSSVVAYREPVPQTEQREEVQRNRRGLSTRQSILAASGRLLEKKGFQSLSVDAVARAAGVTRSSVYHQFHSR